MNANTKTYVIGSAERRVSSQRPCSNAYLNTSIVDYLTNNNIDYLNEDWSVYEIDSDWHDKIWFVDIESIHDIDQIIRETGCDVIVSENTITIYDDYIE